ncbi:DUF6517 family protein [Natrinema salaciae]|uniref:Uncharacterized protein n=1 Tax=Natrinema salaciae TaxID=1186196 RepID=A0A1H9BRC3_9EURY|nr:DUF6517 family protein [Natrinema salaciae]SEP90918.1 hypothetical protein SAMN04489841_0816 [Natrinema salaciae]
MTSTRRSLLAAGATGTIALTAGCLDFVLGNGPLEFTAERVAPTDQALADTEYAEQTVEEKAMKRSEEVAGIERDFKASIWTSVYTKEVEYHGQKLEGSAFAAVSVPGMEVAGQSVNPLDDMSNEQLLEEFLGRVDTEHGQIRDIRHEESFSLDILGDGRDVDTFVGKTELEGETVDIEITVASFDHEDDLLVLLGVLPKMLTEESANVEVLMESVEHPVEN